MAVWHCEGNLLGGLGVCAGHTVYADSKGALDAWAIGKSIGHFTEYSYTRPDKGSINALAPGACHVALPYDQTTQIDYIMFRNNDIDSSRWYYGAVKHRDAVLGRKTASRTHLYLAPHRDFHIQACGHCDPFQRANRNRAFDLSPNVHTCCG